METIYLSPQLLKTAGVTTAAAATLAVGAPSASACFGKGKLPEITILYTNRCPSIQRADLCFHRSPQEEL